MPSRFGWLMAGVWLWCSCAEPVPETRTELPSLAVARSGLESSCARGQDTTPANGVDDCDEDADQDGISNRSDVDNADPQRCRDEDQDLCDDCARGVDGAGPLADNTPVNDGVDTDFDGKCDLGDPDDDDDGVCDEAPSVLGVCAAGPDSHPRDNRQCGDADGDGCDDCSSGAFDLRRDGPDGNADGQCDLSDDADGDGVIDTEDADADNDGIPDALENVEGLDPDADADDDGVPNQWDSDERGDGFANACNDRNGDGRCDSTGLLFDADKDNTPNHLDLDADGDGILDLLEAGLSAHDDDGDGQVDGAVGDNGLLDALETSADSGTLRAQPVDTDGDGVGDHLDTDSDGDGIPDEEEGAGDDDDDGIPNAYDRSTDPDADTDGDGFSDAEECPTGHPCPDSDGDGIPNYTTPDEDGDGVESSLDLDDDNDGILDTVEGDADPDDDGIPARLDLDSDGDGIPDALEARTEALPMEASGALSGPVGQNGVPDGAEGSADSGDVAPPVDSDSDGRADYLDVDSDDDTVRDADEAKDDGVPADSDEDGTPDWRDADDDGDGLATALEQRRERAAGATPDDDGTKAYLDLDADGDGRSDAEEGDVDVDGNGVSDFVDAPVRGPDSDGDGYLDAAECKAPPCRDLDDDGVPDLLDDDDDGDGVPTASERANKPGDRDRDGKLDAYDDDDDGDGLSTREERPDGRDRDTDDDGKPDHLDADDDGDGIPTADELVDGEVTDTDGDALPDHLDSDDDGDGIATRDEPKDEDGNGVPDFREEPGAGGTFVGGALCSAAGPSRGAHGLFYLFALLAGLLVVRRRSAAAAIATPLLLLLATLSPARAQVAVDQFKPALLGEDGFGLTRPVVLEPRRFALVVLLDYAREPLVYERPASTRKRELFVIEDQLVAHAGGAVGLGKGLTLAASLPVHLLMRGEDPGPITKEADGAGLGDLSLQLRALLLDRRHLALGAELTARLPTARLANADQTYSGDEIGSYEPAVVLEGRAGRFDARARVGARFRAPVELRNFDLGQELVYGLGSRVRLVDTLYLHVELTGSTAFARFAEDAYSPLEALLGLKYQGERAFTGVAAGPGLLSGYGSPSYRAVFTVGYAPSQKKAQPPAPVTDSDRDGLSDAQDRCPREPEDLDGFEDADGCPDTDDDQDQVPDASDRCPNQAEDLDGFEDADGCPDTDDDQDQVHDSVDRCPKEAEDRDGDRDDDGCPDLDSDRDGDGVADAADRCPDEAGTAQHQGCAPIAVVEASAGQIRISEHIEFESASDALLDSSTPVLSAVAETLNAHPELTRIRVEGHADDRARDDVNMRLSKKRAASVVRWLTEHGVPSGRLEAYGCGENRPLDPAKTEEARRKNRRVEFHIVEPGQTAEPSGCERAAP